MTKQYRPTICVDFDGVIHSYTTQWSGPAEISDGPVPGAIAWLEELLASDSGPVPVIYSSRSKDSLGVRAMQSWFALHGLSQDAMDKLEFPTQKPAAYLTIDDRAICFDGSFPSADEMLAFKPWNKSDVDYRVVAELTALAKKIDKLEQFLATDKGIELGTSREHLDLMGDQLEAMNNYAICLEDRIKHLRNIENEQAA